MTHLKLFEFEELKSDGSYGEPNLSHATSLSAGFDLRASEDALLGPGKILAVDTGLRIKNAMSGEIKAEGGTIAFVAELQIRPRSGLAAKHGVTVLNAPGTVDADYRGPIKVLLINHSGSSFEIKKGERIAQGVVALAARGSVPEAQKERGTGGFGSTGS